MTKFERLVEEYYRVKLMESTIKKRREKLSKRIKMMIRDGGQTEVEGYKVDLQIKRKRPTYDAWKLEDVLLKKGLHAVATKVIIDEDAVERFYINGNLTDSDLRECIIRQDPNEALIVDMIREEVEMPDVQVDNEGVRT